MKVVLIGRSLAPAIIAGEAAAICTDCDDYDRALRGAMASGHESVLEHASFTFRVEGVSRVLLAQLTRHRLASYSVQSQRYCRLTDTRVITPETISDSHLGNTYAAMASDCIALYQQMVAEGIPEEDARYILPQAITTKLIVTMNARELRHFFSLRCCNRAQWEIRELADRMLEIVHEIAPELFRNAGCACMAGKPCPEGKRSCGKPRRNEA